MTKQELIEQITTDLYLSDQTTVEVIARVVEKLIDKQKPRSTIVKLCDFISALF